MQILSRLKMSFAGLYAELEDFLSASSGGQFLLVALKGWKTAASIIGVMIVLSIVFVAATTKTYTAIAVVKPAKQLLPQSGSSAKGILGKLSGGALGAGSSSSSYEEFTTQIYSYELAQEISENNPIANICYPKQWDRQNHTWKEVSSRKHFGWFVKSLLGFKPNHEVTSEVVRGFIKKHLKIISNKKSDFNELEFEYKDPKVAKEFMIAVINGANEAIRKRDQESTKKNIDYLMRMLRSESSTEVHSALIELLTEQQRRYMLENSGLPYAAEIIDGPYVSPMVKPGLTMSVAIGIIIGLLISLMVFFRRYLKIIKENETGIR